MSDHENSERREGEKALISLDTNLLVRYIVQDDARQSRAAARLIERKCTTESPGYVSLLVLNELVWVLAGVYGYPKVVIVTVIRQLLQTAELVVEDAAVARDALAEFESGSADLADYVIAHSNHAQGCETTYTFGMKASKRWHFTRVVSA